MGRAFVPLAPKLASARSILSGQIVTAAAAAYILLLGFGKFIASFADILDLYFVDFNLIALGHILSKCAFVDNWALDYGFTSPG
jgi:hypothetical protein